MKQVNCSIWFLLFCFSIQSELLGQESQTFRINISSSFIDYQMKEFNERINDPVYIDTNLYDELSRISLSEGFNFGMSVSYRPFQFISLGVYGGYQFGKTERDIRVILNQYDPNTPNDTFPGKRTFETQSVQVGLITSIILNQMNFWKSKPLSSNIECAINVKMGYGWAYLFKDDVFEGVIPNSSKEVYKSEGFQFVSTVQLGYILSNNNYFSSIGLNLGYQYFVTSDLQAEGGLYYPHDKRTKLDFSGFNIGLYLSIGR